MNDEVRAAIEAGAAGDIDWRAKLAEVLNIELFDDLEEWTLLTAMGLPADDNVLERVKAAVGEDRGAECCLWMLIDLEQQKRRHGLGLGFGPSSRRTARVGRLPTCDSGTDADFIAHARTDIPALVAELRAAREVVEAAAQRIGGSHAMVCDAYALGPGTTCDCGRDDLAAALAAYRAVVGEA